MQRPARARAAFESADLVAREDTRHTGRLLAHLGIKKPLLSGPGFLLVREAARCGAAAP